MTIKRAESDRKEVRREVTSDTIDRVFRERYRELYSYALFLLNDPTLAEDIIQESFLYAFDNRRTIKNSESLLYYLRRTIQNKSINLATRNRNIERHHKIIGKADDTLINYDSIYSYITVNEIDEILSRAIEELPAQGKRVFEMSRLNGLRHDEIAEELQISYKTVEVHIYRALKVLKVRLSEFRKRD